MFQSQSKYKLFSYSFLFEKIISPFVDLISDFISIEDGDNWEIITAIDFTNINEELAKEIGNLKSRNNKFKEEQQKCDGGTDECKEALQKEKDEIETERERLKRRGYETINKVFIDKIFASENFLLYHKAKIVFIDKRNKYIIAKNDNILSVFQTVLIKSQLITQLLAHVNKRGTVNFGVLSSFDNKNLYESAINIDEIKGLTCPVINLSYIKEDFNKTPIEGDDIWMSEIFLEEFLLPEVYSHNKNYFILQEKEKKSGVIVGNICFFYDSNSISLIKEERIVDYYWHLLKNNLYRLPSQPNGDKLPLVKEFNEEVKKEDFAYLLSNLKKNLYVEDIDIPVAYQKYFEAIFKLDKLKHLSGYELYLPYESNPESSIVGIYHTDRKPSETHYNLVHWISSHEEENKIYEFSNEKPDVKKKKLIYVLKPEISFYFRYKYFEDFFEEILKESGLNYISNYKVKYKSNDNEAEFDFIIKTDQKIYVIELKTTLRNEEIAKYEKKCMKLMQELPTIQDNLEFIIIGSLSDENCETYRYYIEEGKKQYQDYNSKREEVSIVPYRFTIPIRSSSDKKIVCIAEPSFERLKSIIDEICV